MSRAVDARGLLGPERFLGLASRCGLEADSGVLDGLAELGVLRPVIDAPTALYSPGQLWILSRYLDQVRISAHPWTKWSRKAPELGDAVELLGEDGRKLEASLRWMGGAPSDPGAEARAVEIAGRMRAWSEAGSPLGALRSVVALVRRDVLASLRGDALLTELVSEVAGRMLGNSSTSTLEPVGGGSLDEDSTDEEVAEQIARSMASRSGQQAALERPAGPAARRMGPVNTESGLQAALKRATSERPKPPPPEPIAADTGETDRALPTRPDVVASFVELPEPTMGPLAVVDQPVVTVDESAPGSLEEQVRQLNELRLEYIQSKAWDKLVDLYEDGIYLFPRPSERRQIYFNIGAIYEHKLKDRERALASYEKAHSTLAGDMAVYEALERLYTHDERWDDLRAVAEACREATHDAQFSADLGLALAGLLATRLDQGEASIELYQELLSAPLGDGQHAAVLERLAAVSRSGRAGSKVLLAVASLIEGHWSIDKHAVALVDLYEGMYDGLVEQDPSAAAEVMSRLASIHQATDSFRQAFMALGRALSSDPDREDLYQRLEVLAERLDVLDDLAAIYEDEFDRVLGQSHRASIARRLAALYERLGDEAGVQRAWRTVAEAEPFDTEALGRLADIHARHDEIPELLEVLERLRGQLEGPDRVAVLLRVARVRTEGALDPDSSAADVVDIDAAMLALQDALAEVDFGSRPAEDVVSMIHGLIPMVSQSLAFQFAELLEQFFARHGAPGRVVETYEAILTFHLRDESAAGEAARLLTRMGSLHADQLKRPDDAFVYFARALEADPSCDEAMLRVSDMASTDGRWEALANLSESVLSGGRAKDEEPWHRKLATIYAERLGKPDQAFPHYLELRRINLDDGEATAFLEGYYAENEDWEGLTELLEARADNEGNVAARVGLLARASSLALEYLGDGPRAAANLRTALTLETDDLEMLDRVCALYRSSGQGDEVLDLLARQEELATDMDVKAAIAQRRAEVLAGDPEHADDAIDNLVRLRELKPNDPGVLRQLAEAYEAAGRKLEAYGLCKSLAELGSEGADGKQRAALLTKLATWAEEELGSPEEAASWFRLRLDDDEADLDAITNLERLYEKAGDLPRQYDAAELHVAFMKKEGVVGAAAVLREKQVDLAVRMGDEARELDALADMVALQHGGDLGQLERLADLARAAERWAVALDANERFLEKLEAGEDHVDILHEMAALAEKHIDDEGRVTSYFERAVDAGPTSFAALSKLADRYGDRGRPRDQAAVLRRILELDGGISPQDEVQRCKDLADLLAKELGEPRQAAGLLERALGTIGEYGEVIPVELHDVVRRKAVNVYKRLDETGMALDHLGELHDSFVAREVGGRTLARLCEEIGRLSAKIGRVDDAEKYFLSAVEEDEEATSARLGFAELYVDTEQWPAALEMLEWLVEHLARVKNDRDKAQVFALRGRAYGATNKVKQAMESYQSALEHDPHNATAREAMG